MVARVNIFHKLIWYLTPLWLGTLIRKTTGYVMAARFDSPGKMIAFYFQKQQPSGFDIWPK